MDDDKYVLFRDTTTFEAHWEFVTLPEYRPQMIPQEPGISMKFNTAAMTHRIPFTSSCR